jgi:hypothetical protein
MLDGEDKYATGGSEACRFFDAQVADYLEGEDRPAVVAHATECPFCAVIFADLRALISGSAALEGEDPPARVWANIRATLAAEGVFREPAGFWARWVSGLTSLPGPALVGSLVAVMALAIGLSVSREAFGPRTTPRSPAARVVTVAARPVSGEDAALAETLKELENSYQARKASFDPGLKDTYEKSLASLNNSIRETQDSVEQEPGNTLAREYLDAAYEQKAEVLSAALEYDSR